MRIRPLLVALTALAVLGAAAPSPSPAKDLFFYLGYELIQVVDGDTDAIVGDIPVTGFIRESAFSADNKTLYVTANRHLIHKIDLASRKVVGTADVSSGGWKRFIYGFALAPDGTTAYATLIARTTEAGEVRVNSPVLAQIDLGTGKILRQIDVPWGSAKLVAVKDATQVYVLGKDIVKVDVSGKTMKAIGTYGMFEKQWNILPLWDYSDENGGVFMGNYYTPELMGLVNIHKATGEIEDVPLNGIPVFAYSAIYSPDKKRAYAVMDDLNVIDMETRTYRSIVPMHEGTSYAVNVSSDGKKVYAAGGGSTINVYDAETLALRKVLQMETDGMDLRRLSL
jgi:DNA-binding beta-propeller fold protein YncE